MTSVTAEKIEAYRTTDYMVEISGCFFVLRIGCISNELHNLYKNTSEASALFITAYNPEGSLQSDDENMAAHAALGAYLRSLTPHVFEGEGKGTGDNACWPGEKSFLALGLDHETAVTLGRKLRQDAVVWVGENAIPELLLIR